MWIYIYINIFPETIADQIQIPSVFTSNYASKMLKEFIIPEVGWGKVHLLEHITTRSILKRLSQQVTVSIRFDPDRYWILMRFTLLFIYFFYSCSAGPTWSSSLSFLFQYHTTSFLSLQLLGWLLLWCVSFW